MKYYFFFVLTAFFLAPFSSTSAQIRSLAESLPGVWYKEGRNEIRYSVWVKTAENTLVNRNFSLVCGDTVMYYRAQLTYDESSALLTLDRPEGPVEYPLSAFDEDGMTWENPAAHPKTLSWRFSTGGYAVFAEDGAETSYRRQANAGLHLNFFAALGANVNYYARPVGHNRFLAIGAANAVARTSARKGAEISLAAELGFPSTRFSLRSEFGMAYRQVGIVADFIPIGAGNVQAHRKGYYSNNNFYFGLGPGWTFGKQKRFFVGALFYTDLVQQKYFSGVSNNNLNDASYSDPSNDIDSEHGLSFLFRRNLEAFGPISPSVYVRYTQGLNNTRIRAFSAGVSIALEKI